MNFQKLLWNYDILGIKKMLQKKIGMTFTNVSSASLLLADAHKSNLMGTN